MGSCLPLRLCLPLSVFLLPLPDSALGNFGSATGSCKCRRVNSPPPIVARSLDPPLCHRCQLQRLVRFTYPNISICGWKDDEWVIRLEKSQCRRVPGGKESSHLAGAGARKGHHVPTPTSRLPRLAQSSPSPGRGTLEEETPGTLPAPDVNLQPDADPAGAGPSPFLQQAEAGDVPPAHGAKMAPEVATDSSWERGTTGSPLQPYADRAGAGPSPFPQQAGGGDPPVAREATTAVLALLGVALACVAVTVAVVCWRRRQARPAAVWHRPPGDAGEENVYLPCEGT